MEIRRRLKGELSIFGGTFRKARQDSANDLAAAIAFWASFSIFPLLIGMLSVSSHFLESASLQSSIYEAVTESLPGSSELVKENLDAVVRYRGTMSLVAILGLFWTAGKVFGAITRAVNRALTVQRDRRPLVSKLRYFGMAIVVSILILVSLGITVVLEVALEAPALSKLGLDLEARSYISRTAAESRDNNTVAASGFRVRATPGPIQNVLAMRLPVYRSDKPTDTVVSCESERSQTQNRERAMAVLRARLYEAEQQAQMEERGEERRLQVGSGERSEKIRTYNYPQNRLTDHRIGLTLYRLETIVNGDLDEIIDELATTDQAERLQAIGA